MSTDSTVRHPNFFIVGASRSGTTSLWQYLRRHPDVFLPRGEISAKEPSFFCHVKPCWAGAYQTLDQYLGLFAGATGEKAIGEASTAYLVCPESPGLIRRAYPDARIVVVLRNPVDRAWSLHQYLCLLGVEPIASFERALAAEDARRNDDAFKLHNRFWYYAFLYFETGLYAAQLQRYLDVFPREQIHVLLADDLRADAVKATQGVCRFLGVDATWRPDVVRFNEGRRPMSVGLQYLLGHDWARHPMHVDQPSSVLARLRRMLFVGNVRLGAWREPKMRPATRSMLLERYREDVHRTGELIGRNLDHWCTGVRPAEA